MMEQHEWNCESPFSHMDCSRQRHKQVAMTVLLTKEKEICNWEKTKTSHSFIITGTHPNHHLRTTRHSLIVMWHLCSLYGIPDRFSCLHSCLAARRSLGQVPYAETMPPAKWSLRSACAGISGYAATLCPLCLNCKMRIWHTHTHLMLILRIVSLQCESTHGHTYTLTDAHTTRNPKGT